MEDYYLNQCIDEQVRIGMESENNPREENIQLQARLTESESRYRGLFEDSPISLWEEDFSVVRQHIEQLKSDGVVDFHDYFTQHPNDLQRCAAMVQIIDVNRATLEMYKAGSKQHLLTNLSKVLGTDSYVVFQDELLALIEGRNRFAAEIINHTLKDEQLYVSIQLSVAPGYEDTWARVFVSILDITQRKLAEDQLREAHRDLEEKVLERTAELSAANASLQRAQEYFLSTLEQLKAATRHGATNEELLVYLEQAEQLFYR